jgi:acetylornithine/succinyldiaminopimelate/putrescine aminotransferase
MKTEVHTIAVMELPPWADDRVASSVARRAAIIASALSAIPAQFPAHRMEVRGSGLMWELNSGTRRPQPLLPLGLLSAAFWSSTLGSGKTSFLSHHP